MDVAVLGTGIMGAPMARNLLRAGHDVRVFNRTAEKAAALAGDGATVCEDAAAAVDGAEVVLTMLADGDAVRESIPLGAIADGAIWWQASTVGLERTEDLMRRAGEAGVTYVDAPVLGTRKPAEDGELVVLASGPAGAIDRLGPLLDAVGSKTVRLGEAGQASRLKLVLNHWLVGIVETLAETIVLAEGLGIDPQRFLDTIEGGALDVPYAHLKGRLMIGREFPTSFPLRLAVKDVDLVLEAARREGVDLGLAPAIRDRFARAVDAGHGDEDLAAALLGTAKD